MRRRRLLATLGATLTVGDGCLAAPNAADSPESSDGTPTPRGTADDPTSTATAIPPDSDATVDEESFEMSPSTDAPFETRTLGDRTGVPNPGDNRPHVVTVWNGVDAEREIRARVVGRDVGERLDATWTFPAWGYVELTLNWPDTYRIRPSVGDDDAEEATVPQGFFDCNDSATTVGVFESGEVKQVTVSTMLACDATPS